MALSQKQLSERKNFIGSSEAKIIANGSFEDWAKLISEKKGEQQKTNYPKPCISIFKARTNDTTIWIWIHTF